jgi:LmbE family N-acetylglucosaminyl deacetylase
MAILAHPDDETLGFGGALARYAEEGVETHVVTATRGQRGRYFGHPQGSPEHPGAAALAGIREKELRAAASALGVRQVDVLEYEDQMVDRAPVGEIVEEIVSRIRRVRPQVVVTFGPDGAYGHPDHVAISQVSTAAIVAAADSSFGGERAATLGNAHTVSKLYYLAWSEAAWAAYQAALRKLVSVVDGVERQATPWPDWAITTVVDTKPWWQTVWRAVSCHESQVGGYAALKTLTPEHHEALWGVQSFYRAFSLVNHGRARENCLFEGL